MVSLFPHQRSMTSRLHHTLLGLICTTTGKMADPSLRDSYNIRCTPFGKPPRLVDIDRKLFHQLDSK
jgi:hypothetical protein